MQPQQPHDEEIYRGTLIHVLRRTLQAPSGGQTQFEVVEHPGAVAVVALREDPARPDSPAVALVRQERPAINRATWELPAGLVNQVEAGQPEETARRELREETGYGAGQVRLLTRTYSSPGFTNEAISIYLATGVQPLEGASGPKDPTEISAVAWVPLEEALARCDSGEINDSKTQLGLILARETLERPTDISGGNAMPYSTGSPYPARSAAASQRDPLINTDQTLRLESIMLEEFNYAASTAYEALEDRGRMFSFYLSIATALAGGVGALYEFGNRTAESAIVATALFVLAGFTGLIFLFKIIRIRQAFDDSLLTMNVIKEHYIAQFKATVPDVETIFRWRMKTMPSGRRFGSLTFLVCFAITFIDSVALGLAAALITELVTQDGGTALQRLPTNPVVYIVGAVVFAGVWLAQVAAYQVILQKTGAKYAAKQAAEKADKLGVPSQG